MNLITILQRTQMEKSPVFRFIYCILFFFGAEYSIKEKGKIDAVTEKKKKKRKRK